MLDRVNVEGGEWPSIRPLLSVHQAARFLGVCHATVYMLCERGTLPHFRVLNAIRIDFRNAKDILGAMRRGHKP